MPGSPDARRSAGWGEPAVHNSQTGSNTLNDEATSREVANRFDMVKDLYGDRLDDEQLEEVRKGIEGIVAAAGALRAIELDNGDEPFPVFTPFRREG